MFIWAIPVHSGGWIINDINFYLAVEKVKFKMWDERCGEIKLTPDGDDERAFFAKRFWWVFIFSAGRKRGEEMLLMKPQKESYFPFFRNVSFRFISDNACRGWLRKHCKHAAFFRQFVNLGLQ